MAPHSEKDRFCRVGVTFADLLMGNIHLTSQMWLNAAREKKVALRDATPDSRRCFSSPYVYNMQGLNIAEVLKSLQTLVKLQREKLNDSPPFARPAEI